MYYLAYGSNLNLKEMQKRCPSVKKVGVTTLKDYCLVNRKYLTVEECPGKEVPLGIFSLADEDLASLDFYEDYPKLYFKKKIPILVSGQEEEGLIYIMNAGYPLARPTINYEKVCYKGYEDFGFDKCILEECFKASKKLVDYQREYFRTGITLSKTFRLEKLRILKKTLKKYEEKINQALNIDLGKSEYESYMTEISMIYTEINYFLKQLKGLVKPKRVRTTLAAFPAKSYIYSEPYGNVLIISPWNYPLQLALIPLVGAIAGGNTAIIKVSELAPKVGEVIKQIVTECFPKEYVAVEMGGVKETEALLAEPFDKIFFTGSTKVGKVVMASASKNLTPVTLELGGKSPVIVTQNADLKLAAKRIAWGKILNAGQTCVAPDYVFVATEVKDLFIELLIKQFEEFLGTNPLTNSDYPKIISYNHFQRLLALIDQKSLVYGGKYDVNTSKVEPTILLNPNLDLPCMDEEIFGPILPILTYQSLTEVYDYIIEKPKPLALYLFSKDRKEQEFIFNRLSFGGGCLNDTILHLSVHNLPFGGVGASGMGNYHGKASFKCFTHEKSILSKGAFFDIKLRYQPFTKRKLNFLKKLIK